MGAFFWSKTVSDTIISLLYGILFTIVIYFYFYDLNDWHRFSLMLSITCGSMLCNQCLCSLVGILFVKQKCLAQAISLMLISWMFTYSNSLILLSDMSESQQMISEFIPIKYHFNSLLMIVYGLGRCGREDRHLSKMLFDFGIDQDKLVYKYIVYSYAQYLILLIIVFVIFYLSRNFARTINLILKRKLNFIPEESVNLDIVELNVEKTIEFPKTKRTINIAWMNLSFEINLQRVFGKFQELRILDQITGSFETNSLNALMGPSGAGKTTLLKCLNGLNTNCLTEDSKIFLKYKSLSKNIFIKQEIDEHLLHGLTVRQTLLYASKLKNSMIDRNVDHKSVVKELMEELMISDIIDNRVERCSGGEQKRIAIAAELTAQSKPKFLLIDEPTSGLDSNAAEVVCLE